jgi:hypothetical protein
LALRGGSWDYSEDLARVSVRHHTPPYSDWNNYGFRVVCAPHGFAFLPEVLVDDQVSGRGNTGVPQARPHKGQK